MNNPSTETTNIWAARVARIDPIGHAFLRYGSVVAIRSNGETD
jgi:reactive chlorine resistance protein C